MRKVSDADLAQLIREHGFHETARRLDGDIRSIYRRRDRIETRTGVSIQPPIANRGGGHQHTLPAYRPHRATLNVEDGAVLVGSDGHYWPGPPSTAHRAFVRFCEELKPDAVVLNGDAFDGASISRHPPVGWESRPTVIEEIDAVKERLGEVQAAAGSAKLFWPLGNHDARFETRIAAVAPEYAKVHGVHLRDHFPDWHPCWSVWINDAVVVKHRYKGGTHAPSNNVVNSGLSMVTGHLHSAKVSPWTDYNGTRFGVDTGCLADPDAAAFVGYTEDNPKNWRSGFAVLKFVAGRMLQPQLALVHDDRHVDYCGHLIEV